MGSVLVGRTIDEASGHDDDDDDMGSAGLISPILFLDDRLSPNVTNGSSFSVPAAAAAAAEGVSMAVVRCPTLGPVVATVETVIITFRHHVRRVAT